MMAGSETGIKFVQVKDEAAMSRMAGLLVLKRIRAEADLLMCLATGHSPTGTYEQMVRAYQRDADLFAELRIIKLDEWHGLPGDNPATCEYYLQKHVVGPMRISQSRYVAFDPQTRDAEGECRRISRKLAAVGPIDLAILGIGRNGHLGLNEPGDSLTPGAHVAKLTESTLGHEMLKAAGRPVKQGMTLGIAQLLASREVLLLVCGESKRAAMRQLRSGEVSTQLPASFLHLHPRITCIFDRASA
jgi:putative deaminase/isomerase